MEFVSKLEEILPAEELNFEATPAFGIYKRYLDHAIAHPAKANTELLKFLILKYTKEGDTILDPMAGSYSTCVVAYCLGRNSIGVDIEEKFYNWGLEAKRKVEKAVTVNPKPKITVLKGDARKLSQLLNQACMDVVVTSPPYLNVDNVKRNGEEFWKKAKELGIRWGSKPPSGTEQKLTTSEDNISNFPLGNIDTVITSPPYSESLSEKAGGGSKKNALGTGIVSDGRRQGQNAPKPYSLNQENIGNLKHGEISTIITSPPYGECQQKTGGNQGKGKYHGLDLSEGLNRVKDDYQTPENPENIGNLPHGSIDAVITSPPFGEANRGGGIAQKGYEGKYGKDEKLHLRHDRPLSDNPDNISNLPYVDTIITSPPYAQSAQDSDKSPCIVKPPRKEDVRQSPRKPPINKYSDNPENIGNMPYVDTVITSPPFAGTSGGKGEKSRKPINERYPGLFERCIGGNKGALSENPDNIDNLPYVDAVITSPPYEGSLHADHLKPYGIAKRDLPKGNPKNLPFGYSERPENIGNLKSSDDEYQALVDSIITSPPYAHESTASKPTKLEKEGMFKMGHSKEVPYTDEDYRSWDRREGGNIAKRKLFVRVPCSPEEAQFHDTRPERRGTVWEWTKEVEATPEVIEKIQKLKRKGKSETYLEAMLKVYREMFKVLKHGGRAIVIVKAFIRNKKVVDLPYHTWLLMAKVGFKLEKLYKLRLQQESFWRILYKKKHSDVPEIKHEYILVCKKP